MYVLKELCLDYVKTSQSNNPPKTEAEFKHFPRCIMHQESVNRNQKFMSAYQKHDYYYLHRRTIEAHPSPCSWYIK